MEPGTGRRQALTSRPKHEQFIILFSVSGVVRMYRHDVAVAAADIDHMGHVNNAVYLRWVQDAVVAYWQNTAPADAVANHLWVALNHNISYRAPAFLEDDVVASVVAEGVQGARAFFTTMFKRGEQVIAEVKSTWCCIDVATMRPARLARDVVSLFLPT
jgi:acyl-CoA thioester hydrolase